MQERVGASEGRHVTGCRRPQVGDASGDGGSLRVSHLEVPHSWLPLCPHTFPLPQTGMSWTSKVAVEAVFHILIMDALHRTHGK